MTSAFTPESLRFLRGLIRNNDRTWFEERRPVYERAVKQPTLALIEHINDALLEIAPEHVRPPHKVAMRIYRDIRFSPDKRPYKRHTSAWWARQGLEKRSAAGFYLQIGPQESFFAAGVYAPERDDLLALRRWMAEHHERYHAALAPVLRAKGKQPAMQQIEANALSRNPKGFSPDHPAGALLRQRNWGVSLPFAAEAALAPEFPAEVVRWFRRAAPVVEVLNEPFLQAEERRPPAPAWL